MSLSWSTMGRSLLVWFACCCRRTAKTCRNFKSKFFFKSKLPRSPIFLLHSTHDHLVASILTCICLRFRYILPIFDDRNCLNVVSCFCYFSFDKYASFVPTKLPVGMRLIACYPLFRKQFLLEIFILAMKKSTVWACI